MNIDYVTSRIGFGWMKWQETVVGVLCNEKCTIEGMGIRN